MSEGIKPGHPDEHQFTVPRYNHSDGCHFLNFSFTSKNNGSDFLYRSSHFLGERAG